MSSSPEVHKIVELVRMMGESHDLKKLLLAIEGAGRELLECERAFIWLYHAPTHEFTSHTVNANRVSADNGIAGLTLRTGEAIYSQDAANDTRYDPSTDRELGAFTRDLLTIPLRSADSNVVGVMQLHNTKAGELLQSHTRMAELLGSLAGIAIRRQVLLDEASEMRRLEGELGIARRIMEGLLPRGSLNINELEVAGWTLAADFVGGDTFDLYPCGDKLLFMLADAMGHGIGPTLIAAEFRAMLRASIHGQDDLASIARVINNLLCDDLKEGRFLTACFGFVDLNKYRVSYVNAGHGMTFFIKPEQPTRSLEATGIPLGVMPDVEYEVTHLDLESGDVLAMLTDGLVEWKNPLGEQFGEERVLRLLELEENRSCRNLIQRLYEDVQAFAAGTRQADDLTALLLRRR